MFNLHSNYFSSRFMKHIWRCNPDVMDQSMRIIVLFVMLLDETIYLEINNLRPKLGRSCRCILMLGHGYEPVVDFVLLILNYSNFPTSLTTLYSTLMSLNFVIKNIFLTPLDFTLLSRNVFKLKCLVPLHPFQPYWNSHLN